MTLEYQFDALIRQYAFATRIHAERLTMKEAAIRFVSTSQEKEEQYQHAFYRDLFQQEDKPLWLHLRVSMISPSISGNRILKN